MNDINEYLIKMASLLEEINSEDDEMIEIEYDVKFADDNSIKEFLLVKKAEAELRELQKNVDEIYTEFVVTAKKKKQSGIAKKTNPSLWSRCKSEAKSRMGGKHSARAMQLATKLYKQRGGGYSGKKPTAKTNKMKKWTKQKWMYLSDYKKKDKNKADDFGIDGDAVEEGILETNPELADPYGDTFFEGRLDESPNEEPFDADKLLNPVNPADLDNLDAKDNPGRYLPEAKWKSLSPKERAATDQKKKRQGKNKQYVENTEKAKVKSKAKYY